MEVTQRLCGVSVTVEERVQIGVDPLGAPVYGTSRTSTVKNVLVGNPTAEDVKEAWDLYGKRVVYRLAIPKGDAHDWIEALVTLPAPFSGVYRVIGEPVATIEEMAPLAWNKQVRVERYA